MNLNVLVLSSESAAASTTDSDNFYGYQKQSVTVENRVYQEITMFLNKIFEAIIVIHSKLYVRFHIIKPASEKSPCHPTL